MIDAEWMDVAWQVYLVILGFTFGWFARELRGYWK